MLPDRIRLLRNLTKAWFLFIFLLNKKILKPNRNLEYNKTMWKEETELNLNIDLILQDIGSYNFYWEVVGPTISLGILIINNIVEYTSVDSRLNRDIDFRSYRLDWEEIKKFKKENFFIKLIKVIFFNPHKIDDQKEQRYGQDHPINLL